MATGFLHGYTYITHFLYLIFLILFLDAGYTEWATLEKSTLEGRKKGEIQDNAIRIRTDKISKCCKNKINNNAPMRQMSQVEWRTHKCKM